MALFTNWKLADNEGELIVTVDVNLAKVLDCFNEPLNAVFEVESLIQWLSELLEKSGEVINGQIIADLELTKQRLPRFYLKERYKVIDVPDFANPLVPELRHYKNARNDLAKIFKDLGVNPGRFEVADAKTSVGFC